MVKTNRKEKPDTKVNDGSLDAVIERFRQKERTLFPLRINKQTVIFVARKKCNEQYRQEYLRKMHRI